MALFEHFQLPRMGLGALAGCAWQCAVYTHMHAIIIIAIAALPACPMMPLASLQNKITLQKNDWTLGAENSNQLDLAALER